MRDPQTPEQWQEAVNGAEGALTLDAARQYGLVIGGPPVNVDRCCEILERGRHRGITPEADAVERFTAALVSTGLVAPAAGRR